MFVGSGKRSGTRGGADQFSWEKVKGDKYKDFYLGHSLHTTAKPTFNNRKPNPLWWTKAQEGSNGEVDDAARRRAEIAAIKREEEQLHQEALGLAPRRRKAQETQLDSNEIQELTRRGNTERDAYDAERVAGLGFAPAPQHQTDATLLPTTSRSASGEGEGGDAERRTGESRDEWEEAPGNDLTTTTTTKAKRGDKKDPSSSSSSSSRRDKEERREEKRRRKEEKRKRKEKAKKDKRSVKERSERDKHARTEGSDRSRGREAGASNRDDDRKRRLHGDEHGREERSRHRRDSRSASRSPKRRRHDSPSPPVRRRSRHDSP